jgi:hypothetical protein
MRPEGFGGDEVRDSQVRTLKSKRGGPCMVLRVWLELGVLLYVRSRKPVEPYEPRVGLAGDHILTTHSALWRRQGKDRMVEAGKSDSYCNSPVEMCRC